MKSDDALLKAWRETLSQKKDAPAIFTPRGEILRTFRAIDERARAFENKIEIFSAGDVIAIQIGNHEDWPSILLASLRRKLVVLPLEQSISQKQRDDALKICGTSGVVAAGVSAGSELKLLPPGTAAATTTWKQNPPSLLKLTSGTTAAPRAIRFRSEQLLADCKNICDTMGIKNVDLNFAVTPVSHSYGFSNLITPLIARGVAMVLSRDRTPRAVLNDLAQSNATVFPGTPVFFQAFCEMENVPALPKLRLCISAGAPLASTVAKKFSEKFGQPIHSFYGASECGGICYDRAGKVFEDGFVGRPMRNVDLRIVDPDANGSRIEVRSAAVGDGYFPERDDEKLHAGIFVPDDLLRPHGDGFKIVGRVSDLINVAGKKVNPLEIETELRRFDGVRDAIVFGRESPLRNEEVVACVITNVDLNESELLEFCRARLSAWQAPKRIFFVDQVPANERGKISRRELAKHFAGR